MTDNIVPVKAIQATIKIGDVEIDCYQMPAGEYRMSKIQACNVVNLDHRRFAQIFKSKHLQSILP